MNMWRWFGSFVVMTGLFALVANLPVLAQDKEKKQEEKKVDDKKADDKKAEEKKVEEKGKEAPPKVAPSDPDTLVFKAFAKKDNKFYQELTTDTVQVMRVMGQEVKQEQKQTFYIEWTAGDPKGDDWIVTQKIIGVKMNINIGGNNIAYDSTEKDSPANPMTDFFKALTQAELKLTIDSKKMTVSKVEGATELIEKLGSTNTQLQPLLKSILSDAALKQMAEPTWGAFPLVPAKKDTTWTKDFSLDLGGIGSYDTKYTYTVESIDKANAKIKIDAKLDYKAPTDKRNLPFTIKSAKLASTQGTGHAMFDREKGRIESSEITMKLSGDLEIDVSGMTTSVQLTQDQTSKVKTSDTNPIPAPKK